MSEVNDAATNLYNRLRTAPTFHPAGADLFTDWNLQAGDVVTVKSGTDSYQVPIYGMKLKWSGAPKVEVESTGNPEREPLPAIRRREYSAQAGNYSAQKSLRGGVSGLQGDVANINGEIVSINGDITEIKGTGVFQNSERITEVAGKFTVDGSGNVHVINGSQLYLGENQASMLVYTEGNLTAGGIVEKINNGTSKIISNKLDVDTVALAAWGAYTDNTLTGGILVEKLNDNSTTTTILGDRINVRASDKVTWGVVDSGDYTASVIVSKINGGSVTINANRIDLQGYVTASQLDAVEAEITDLMAGNASASKLVARAINVSNLEITNELVYGGYGDLKKKIINALSSSASGGTITISSTTLDGTAGPSVNFNIADTAYYQNGVSAAAYNKQVGTNSFIVYNESSDTTNYRVYFNVEAIANDGTIYTSSRLYVDYPSGSNYTSVGFHDWYWDDGDGPVHYGQARLYVRNS